MRECSAYAGLYILCLGDADPCERAVSSVCTGFGCVLWLFVSWDFLLPPISSNGLDGHSLADRVPDLQ